MTEQRSEAAYVPPTSAEIASLAQQQVTDPAAEWPDESYVVNPEAIGDPDRTPVVRLSINAAAVFRPCVGNAPSRNGYCGGVNGFHAEDCPDA